MMPQLVIVKVRNNVIVIYIPATGISDSECVKFSR